MREWRPPDDDVRRRLLAAAARAVAESGYQGTSIRRVAELAGLSTGAVYARFSSKDQLLTEAMLTRVEDNTIASRLDGDTVADLWREACSVEGSLDEFEATLLELTLAAKRSVDVGDALEAGRLPWRSALAVALEDGSRSTGTASDTADIKAISHLMEAVHLGLLVQRSAGRSPGDPDGWRLLLTRVLATLSLLPTGPQGSPLDG